MLRISRAWSSVWLGWWVVFSLGCGAGPDPVATALDELLVETRAPGAIVGVRYPDATVRVHASGVRSLESGEGKEETLPRFKRIETLRNGAAENGRRAMIPDDVFAYITPVGTALIKLAPYYR